MRLILSPDRIMLHREEEEIMANKTFMKFSIVLNVDISRLGICLVAIGL